MTIVNILPGANNKPAYIEYLKDEAASPTLLSVSNFRSRFGDELTDTLLGISSDADLQEGDTDMDATAAPVCSSAEETGEPFGEGLFSAAS